MAANEVSGAMTDGGGLLTTYAAWRCARSLCVYVVLAANEVSEVAVMTMGVAAHHSPAPVPRTWQGRARSLSSWLQTRLAGQ